MTKTHQNINRIVIHCSDTPEGRPHDKWDIDRWHKERGFDQIGYHYVILLDGSIEKGRQEHEVGAHVRGHNSGSLGICYIGGKDAKTLKPKDTRTPEQVEALKKLCVELAKKYPSATFCGHRDLDKGKECPCFDVKSFIKESGIA
ncbi:N-acetylmuramoyl-L-alanine amidase [Helicobacter cynogastricus]|uniref:N-acetylmuramoyl-L-alanine amidase n=1 Tax=Helicobacter cynogastricus TaxID=329937 RepID=UPI000CF184DF|nr:N-acetylmuramoyl-L-alanine amidase [Helicobacter cynogastricus]